MTPKPSIPVPQYLYFVDGGFVQSTCSSRARADEIADYWRHMFRIDVKIYVYERWHIL